MTIVLRQIFPLGRFHATPWRVSPFDDPFGEWPPSPWRLVRAVAARWHQWYREDPEGAGGWLEPLVRAMCGSTYAFHLPARALRGTPVRQYFPVEFGFNPKDKKKAALRCYSTSLAQDNYVCVPTDRSGAVWWFLEGEWDEGLAEALDECLRRMNYFGRAETYTRIELHRESDAIPEANCLLKEKRFSGAVPVLVPEPTALVEDIERVTDDPLVVERSIPPGARVMYAKLPSGQPLKEVRSAQKRPRKRNLIQFAIGWNVAPEMRAIVRLTAKFRGAVLKEMLRERTGDPQITWSKAPRTVREELAEMAGKDAEGRPLEGHRHTEYLVWCEDGEPVRLLAWRSGRPFDEIEEHALLKAAERQYSWGVTGNDADAWKVRLVPLDRAVPPPPGFDRSHTSEWESITPYVPPRHHLRGGKPRERETIEEQIRRELALRGVGGADKVIVEHLRKPEWVAVHVPRSQRGASGFLGDRRGYWLRLRFPEPVTGPIRLGHSSSFGLGLFGPVLPRSG